MSTTISPEAKPSRIRIDDSTLQLEIPMRGVQRAGQFKLDQRKDIPELCALFLRQIAQDLKTRPRSITAEAMRVLLSYQFPGNIRELRNLIEHAYILSTDEEITLETLPVPWARNTEAAGHRNSSEPTAEQLAEMMPETHDLREFLASLEKAVIQRALKMTGGAQAEVAVWASRAAISRTNWASIGSKYQPTEIAKVVVYSRPRVTFGQ